MNLTLAVFLAGAVTTSTSTGTGHRHHILPMYLGGAIAGAKVFMDRTLHLAYHGFLDRSGLARRNAAEFQRMIAEGRMQEILEKLLTATQRLDQMHGTQLHSQLLEVLRSLGYRF